MAAEKKSTPGALEELLAREIRKLEKVRVFYAHLERRRQRSGAAQPLEPDPALDELGQFVRPSLDTRLHWIEVHLVFLQRVLLLLRGASRREEAFFWLGAACPFLGAPMGVGAQLHEREERVEEALRYFSDLARASDAEEDETRLSEEPWDASGGMAPRREMRGAWILREALDLLRQQREALEVLEEDEREGEG